MGKKVYIVAPCHQDRGSNFKKYPFKAWKELDGKESFNWYLPKKLRGIAYNIAFPSLIVNHKVAYLRLVEACSISFDTFPHYIWGETIPIIWDCWPQYFDKIAHWLKRHQVKTAIFTSSQTASKMQETFPEMNILFLPEGIDVKPYHAGDELANRSIDLLEYGNVNRNFFKQYVEGIKHINVKNSQGRMATWDKLLETISDSKVVIALPRCDTEPILAGGIETLTQRFWEGMLSRTVLLGRAPKELLELIGYNPVIDLDKNHPDEQVRDIVNHISDYQELVDKNRETALRMAPWEIRMKKIMTWLESLGYQV